MYFSSVGPLRKVGWTLFSDLSGIGSHGGLTWLGLLLICGGWLSVCGVLNVFILVRLAELKVKMLVQSKVTGYLNRLCCAINQRI